MKCKRQQQIAKYNSKALEKTKITKKLNATANEKKPQKNKTTNTRAN